MNGDNTKRLRVVDVTQLPKLTSRIAADLEQKDIPPIKWVIEGILHEGLFIFAGKPKVGKSWMCLHWAVSIANGTPAFNAIPVKPGLVYYLALEDPERRVRDRLRKIPGGFSNNLHYAIIGDLERLDEGAVERLDDWLIDHPDCRMVVVDTLGRVKPKKRKFSDDYADSVKVGDQLQQLAFKHHICLILVYHNRKADSPDGDYLEEVHGTIGLTGTADATLVLKRTRKQINSKLLGTSREQGEIELGLKFDPDDSVWQFSETPLDASPVEDVLYRAIKQYGPITPKDLAMKTGDNYNTLKNNLQRMYQKSMVQVRDGRYYV